MPSGYNYGYDAKKASTGMDPLTIGLIGASALGGLFGGGGDGAQERNSFRNTGADPIVTLRDTLESIKRMGGALGSATPMKLGGVQLRKPAPITIPGVPFQIGGGLGANPSLGDPAYVNPYAIASQIFGPNAGGSAFGPGKGDLGGGSIWDKITGLDDQLNGAMDQVKTEVGNQKGKLF